MYQLIKWEKEGPIGILTINSPATLNALNSQVLKELDTCIDEVLKDESIGALIITGEGKAFVAGADIKEMLLLDHKQGEDWGAYGSGIFRKIETLPLPVIAAVNGFALGGGNELAISCDIRIASEKAKFGQPEVGLGIIPGFAGTQRLPRLIGPAAAKELIYTGKIIGAQEAKELGLVSRVVAPEELMDVAKELAQSILKNSWNAVALGKKAINDGLQLEIEDALELEAELFGEGFKSPDQKEGMSAFVEKRPAQFNYTRRKE